MFTLFLLTLFIINGYMVGLHIPRPCSYYSQNASFEFTLCVATQALKANVGLTYAGLLCSPHLRGLCFHPEPFPVGQIPVRSKDSNCASGVVETATPWPVPPWPTRTCPRPRSICSVSSQHHRRCANNCGNMSLICIYNLTCTMMGFVV